MWILRINKKLQINLAILLSLFAVLFIFLFISLFNIHVCVCTAVRLSELTFFIYIFLLHFCLPLSHYILYISKMQEHFRAYKVYFNYTYQSILFINYIFIFHIPFLVEPSLIKVPLFFNIFILYATPSLDNFKIFAISFWVILGFLLLF